MHDWTIVNRVNTLFTSLKSDQHTLFDLVHLVPILIPKIQNIKSCRLTCPELFFCEYICIEIKSIPKLFGLHFKSHLLQCIINTVTPKFTKYDLLLKLGLLLKRITYPWNFTKYVMHFAISCQCNKMSLFFKSQTQKWKLETKH